MEIKLNDAEIKRIAQQVQDNMMVQAVLNKADSIAAGKIEDAVNSLVNEITLSVGMRKLVIEAMNKLVEREGGKSLQDIITSVLKDDSALRDSISKMVTTEAQNYLRQKIEALESW